MVPKTGRGITQYPSSSMEIKLNVAVQYIPRLLAYFFEDFPYKFMRYFLQKGKISAAILGWF